MDKTQGTKKLYSLLFILMIITAIILSIKNGKIEKTITKSDAPIVEEIKVDEAIKEKLFVEKYIKDNIKTITTDEPVLGGSWYVVSVLVNAVNHEGEVTYEDGHIQSQANFSYSYDKNSQNIVITKFEIK